MDEGEFEIPPGMTRDQELRPRLMWLPRDVAAQLRKLPCKPLPPHLHATLIKMYRDLYRNN